MKNKVLLVEDSLVVSKMLHSLVSQSELFSPLVANCYREAQACLDEYRNEIFVAIVDLNLPDAAHGQIVDLVFECNIPCIVLTGNFDDEMRLSLLNKGVVDYITKDTRNSFNSVIAVLNRLAKNRAIKVLVAEDSSTSRMFIKVLLERYQFQVLEAENGLQALAKLEEDSDIRMLITDHNMPLISGCDLVRMLRNNARFEDLVIIGLSAEGDSSLSAKFIKSGANDFLRKPFHHEEFYCRINQNIEVQEMFKKVRDLANIDPLTGLYNRRYLFVEGESIYQKSIATERVLSVVMLDLDCFKAVNDVYGHLLGDAVLEEFALRLKYSFSEGFISRFDGAEFCLLIPLNNLTKTELVQQVAQFCDGIKSVPFTKNEIYISCSAGVLCDMQSALGEAVGLVDERLSLAKKTGRDRLVVA